MTMKSKSLLPLRELNEEELYNEFCVFLEDHVIGDLEFAIVEKDLYRAWEAYCYCELISFNRSQAWQQFHRFEKREGAYKNNGTGSMLIFGIRWIDGAPFRSPTYLTKSCPPWPPVWEPTEGATD